MNTTVKEYYVGKKLLPSKLAEMIAEVELEGYTIKQWELGYNIFVCNERVLDKSCRTKEELVIVAYDHIFNRPKRRR